MKPCRECQHEISESAITCPSCGAPYPARPAWDGWGFEYKSEARVMGLPLLHISFKFRPNKVPVPAVGFIAIGQFGAGIITIAQFGIGVFSLGQFTLAGYAVAQFALAYSCIAQIGVYVDRGFGQFVVRLSDLLPGLLGA
ncbi:zinc ribbon domain-containing protein [Thiorhodococcus mannitoliphagus]|uniref:Zinc ribbon domain-containing protein n=1 Tax=Thiorhodococcus mannitoliphagus TaxID=329406 RepID=A0A6P1DTH8_9GAMM|nr:zinc ribbon domain-containing protein [Thiorhodococcus mannitoliphagus]NEX21627.1 zinc ribbon domain-containing protein [Thiorhodococcus mannitoliphagus]